MTTPMTSVFALPDTLARKAAGPLVEADEQHFRLVADTLEATIADLTARLDAARRAPARAGQAALDRDQEVHRLTARLRTLRRFGLDLCLGRMVPADGAPAVYVGRLGLTDPDGRRLLVDWRSPAAEPFFGATLADPMGLHSRRRYRWARGRIADYWDETFAPGTATDHLALDDDSSFLAGLAAGRSPRMRDVLATIQADQDAIIRAGSSGALVVDGGPGTGKTVVALHRSAYLLYADPRLSGHRGGVLFVGPHQPYLTYVADVLPGLGEDGVQTCTLRDLLPEGGAAGLEPDPEVALLKADARLVAAIEPAVALYEEPPEAPLLVETPWGDVRLSPRDWAEAFAAPADGTPHNEARDDVHEALIDLLLDRLLARGDGHEDDEATDAPTEAQVRRVLEAHRGLRAALHRAWPMLDPAELVGDLWSVPAYLRRCAPWLEQDDVRRLQRPDAQAWTTSDLPLLDAARRRLGDPEAGLRRRRRAATLAAERERRAEVVGDLIASDDSELLVMSMLRGDDLQDKLDDRSGLDDRPADPLAGPFAHVVVDEAQELTDAEWQMLVARCPGRSFTVVGDRAQARRGFAESWTERLNRVGLADVTVAGLTVNYRTPEEVMDEAAPVIRAVLPDANVPTSVRRSGLPVVRRAAGPGSDLSTAVREVLDLWLARHDEGTACVIAADETLLDRCAPARPAGAAGRVRRLTPSLAKGLEFDLVVLADPGTWGEGIGATVDRYVAMTRTTRELVIVEP